MELLSSMSSGVWGLMLGAVRTGLRLHIRFSPKGGWEGVKEKPPLT